MGPQAHRPWGPWAWPARRGAACTGGGLARLCDAGAAMAARRVLLRGARR